MFNKKKQSSPELIYEERWQELATDPRRLSEAREEYVRQHPKVKLVEAHKVVKAHYDQHLSRVRAQTSSRGF